MKIPDYLLREITEKLYHRWDTNQVVKYIAERWKEMPEGGLIHLEETITKIEKEVRDFRYNAGRSKPD